MAIAKHRRHNQHFVRSKSDEQAASKHQGWRAQRIRIGTMDLKIAAIALAHDALPLSANLRDFQQTLILVLPIGLIEP
jgi:predicted nucleic acid-binding protein